VCFPGWWRPCARATGVCVPGPPASSSHGRVAERPVTSQAAAEHDASRGGGAVKSSLICETNMLILINSSSTHIYCITKLSNHELIRFNIIVFRINLHLVFFVLLNQGLKAADG
jgi:hypothetical protein